MEQDLYSRLSTVGTVYPVKLPQKPTFPAITYQLVSALPASHVSGASTLTSYRVQIDCWGETYQAAKGLANQVWTAMDGYEGAFTSVVITSRDEFEQGAEIFRVSIDVSIWHRG